MSSKKSCLCSYFGRKNLVDGLLRPQHLDRLDPRRTPAGAHEAANATTPKRVAAANIVTGLDLEQEPSEKA